MVMEIMTGKYEKLGLDIGSIVEDKQRAYGNSVGVAAEVWHERLKMYDDGDGYYRIPKKLIDHMLLILRIDDKIMRLVSNPTMDRMDENPWQDITGYGIIASCKEEDKKKDSNEITKTQQNITEIRDALGIRGASQDKTIQFISGLINDVKSMKDQLRGIKDRSEEQIGSNKSKDKQGDDII